MFKFILKAFACLFVAAILQNVQPHMGATKNLLISIAIFFAAPAVYAQWKKDQQESRWKREAAASRAAKENADEQAHQIALRRERERMEMHAEIRIKELLATLEVQFRIDARKMEQLSQMKAEFANRQNSDMASLLGRLEAMKAGA